MSIPSFAKAQRDLVLDREMTVELTRAHGLSLRVRLKIFCLRVCGLDTYGEGP